MIAEITYLFVFAVILKAQPIIHNFFFKIATTTTKNPCHAFEGNY